MLELGNIVFVIEILLAEAVFLHSADRKKRFALRYASAFVAVILVASFFPLPSGLLSNPFYQLLRFLLLFGLTVAGMGLCFRLSFSALWSGCVAGYAVQHIAYQATALVNQTGLLAGFQGRYLTRQYLLELLAFPPVYLVLFFTAGLYAARSEWHKKTDNRFNLVSLVIVFICVGLSRFTRYFGDFGSISVSLYAITCCALALVVQFVLCRMADLRLENTTINLLWQEDRRQYELSKKTIDTINIKYHDLKHMLAGLKGRLPDNEIASIKNAVRVYSSRFKTGNEALDVLLAENSLRCGEEGITLTYMGNGADISFMNVMDVYSLFGNAIDNAVEAVRKVQDPEKKIIDIVTERMGGMISINISNFFAGEVVLDDGMPVTTKGGEEGFHGFGMKSMRLITEKYGGRLTADVENDLFSLGIYLLEQ